MPQIPNNNIRVCVCKCRVKKGKERKVKKKNHVVFSFFSFFGCSNINGFNKGEGGAGPRALF
jgi:hypothetical protein